MNSPVPPQGPPPPPPTTTNSGTSNYARAVKEPPLQHDLEDMQMEDGEVGKFPPLPNPQQPWEPRRGPMTIPRGASWMPATRGRPVVTRRGGFGGHVPPRLPTLIILSVEELERHLDAANIPGNELALSHMRAYVRDAQNIPREMRSPVQNTALMK